MVGSTNGSETAISSRTFSRNSSTTVTAAVVLLQLDLAAVTAHATDCDARDAGSKQRGLHLRQPLGADNSSDEFHQTASGSGSSCPIPPVEAVSRRITAEPISCVSG